jgi:peroxiredoxin Q/BCP
MAQLRDAYDDISARAGEVVVVGPESAAAFDKFWHEQHLPFVGLPDPSHQVLKRYGQQVKLFKLGRMPAQVVVDRKGRVRFVYYGHSMADIPEPAEILTLLNQIDDSEVA